MNNDLTITRNMLGQPLLKTLALVRSPRDNR